MDAFEGDLSAVDWSLATKYIDTNLSFKTFLPLFHRVIDKDVLLKKTTKREKTREMETMGYKRYKIYKS